MKDQVRWEKVRRIKREIEEGTYVTKEKLDATVDRMLGASLMSDAECALDPRHLNAMLGRSTCQSDHEDE